MGCIHQKSKKPHSLKDEQRNIRDCVGSKEIEVLNNQQWRRIGKGLREGRYELKILARVF